MKLRLITLATALLFVTGSAFQAQAADAKSPAAPAVEKKLTSSQQRMTDCNKEASEKSLKGPERKEFMRTCMHGDAKPATQQDRMRNCNKEAGEKALKGPDRKAFMSDCLKNK